MISRLLGSPLVYSPTRAHCPIRALGRLSLLLNHNIVADLIGIAVGHIYFFLEDVFPTLPASRGRKVLHTPRLLRLVLDGQPPPFAEEVHVTHMEPNGFEQ